MELERTFKKTTILDLIEGDAANASPDGNLNRDKPLYEIIEIKLLSKPTKKVEVKIKFDSDQGSVVVKDSRFLTFEYDTSRS